MLSYKLPVWAAGIEHFGPPLFKYRLKSVCDGRSWALSISPKNSRISVGSSGKGNVLGGFSENPKVSEFLKCIPFNWKFKDENQMEQKFLLTCFGNSGIAGP